MKIKKVLIGFVATSLILSLETMSAFAAVPAGGRNSINSDNSRLCNYCGSECQFIDEDGDGICDNYSNQKNCGKGLGLGYIDEDGDGVCDNYVSGRRGGRGGCGVGRGRGCGRR